MPALCDYITKRGQKSIANRKTETSTEVKNRWIKNNYKRYSVSLRYDTDQDLIDYIETHKDEEGRGVTGVIRDALKKQIEEG